MFSKAYYNRVMDIVIILVVRENVSTLLDTIEAVNNWVTDKVLVIVDGAAARWGNKIKIPAHKKIGLRHEYHRGPYRNYTLGFSSALEEWPEADWYCKIDYDTLFVSDDFKQDLEVDSDVWCIGNDYRNMNLTLPFLEKIVGEEISVGSYLLGSCVFCKGDFIRLLGKKDFFNRLLFYTNDFYNGFFPGYEEHSFEEYLYPTLASHYGGKIKELACWKEDFSCWKGNFRRYPMRWQPSLGLHENFPEASIMHPIKESDHPIRIRRKRERNVKH